MNEALQALNFDLTTFVLMTINVVVVMVVLYKLLYKPFGNILEARKDKINKDLHEAAQANQRAHLNEIRYQELLSQARLEAKRIVNEAEEMGEEMKRQALEDARKRAGRILAKARDEIADERERAKLDVREDVARMSLSVAEKILQKEIDPEKHKDLIREAIQEAGRF